MRLLRLGAGHAATKVKAGKWLALPLTDGVFAIRAAADFRREAGNEIVDISCTVPRICSVSLDGEKKIYFIDVYWFLVFCEG